MGDSSFVCRTIFNMEQDPGAANRAAMQQMQREQQRNTAPLPTQPPYWPPFWPPPSYQGRHCPTLAGMARVETPVLFTHLISFLSIFSRFLPLCHRILPIVSPVFEIFETPGMAIAIPAILVSPPLVQWPV